MTSHTLSWVQVEQAGLAHLCTTMSSMHHRRASYPFSTGAGPLLPPAPTSGAGIACNTATVHFLETRIYGCSRGLCGGWGRAADLLPVPAGNPHPQHLGRCTLLHGGAAPRLDLSGKRSGDHLWGCLPAAARDAGHSSRGAIVTTAVQQCWTLIAGCAIASLLSQAHPGLAVPICVTGFSGSTCQLQMSRCILPQLAHVCRTTRSLHEDSI